MHDPMTVAHEIKAPWRQKPNKFWPKGYRETLVTIWHRDPERDGSDDSCGWFKRARHGDQATLEAIRKEFAFHWTWGDADQGWFHKDSDAPKASVQAIVVDMFFVAARRFYAGRFDEHGWSGARRFMQRHLFDVIQLAEGGTDNLSASITQRYGPERREARVEHLASVVYGCLLRWTQSWYEHPRWHFWHWRVQIHPVQAFKRWAFSRCAGCRKRFKWGYAPTAGQWSGTGPLWFRGEQHVYHSDCYGRHVSKSIAN